MVEPTAADVGRRVRWSRRVAGTDRTVSIVGTLYRFPRSDGGDRRAIVEVDHTVPGRPTSAEFLRVHPADLEVVE